MSLDISKMGMRAAMTEWRAFCASVVAIATLTGSEKLELVQQRLIVEVDLFSSATYNSLGGKRASFLRQFLTEFQGEECLTCGNALDIEAASNSMRYPRIHTLIPNLVAYGHGINGKRVGHLEGNLYVSCGVCAKKRDAMPNVILASDLGSRAGMVPLVWESGTSSAIVREDESAYVARSERGAIALGII